MSRHLKQLFIFTYLFKQTYYIILYAFFKFSEMSNCIMQFNQVKCNMIFNVYYTYRVSHLTWYTYFLGYLGFFIFKN